MEARANVRRRFQARGADVIERHSPTRGRKYGQAGVFATNRSEIGLVSTCPSLMVRLRGTRRA